MTEAKEGDWLLIRDWGIAARQIDKITPKLFKLGAGTSRYPTQIGREDRKIIGAIPTREIADKLRQSIAGADGEYSRRERASREEHSARLNAARTARDKAIAKLIYDAVSS